MKKAMKALFSKSFITQKIKVLSGSMKDREIEGFFEKENINRNLGNADIIKSNNSVFYTLTERIEELGTNDKIRFGKYEYRVLDISDDERGISIVTFKGLIPSTQRELKEDGTEGPKVQRNAGIKF